MKHKFFNLTNKSFEELGVVNFKEMWEKVKSEGYTAIQAGFVAEMKKAEGSENLFHATISDSLEDRHGDVVIQEWELKNFKKNPVLLDSHDYYGIDKILGHWEKVSVVDKKLQGDIVFSDVNPRGVLARGLVEEGNLNAISAGFIPLEFGKKGEILRSELLEASLVSVPANPRTLVEKKIDTTKKTVEEGKEEEEEENVVKEKIEEEKKRSIFKALNEKLEKQDNILRAVAKEMNGIKKENVEVKKRNIWKSLRKAL